VSQNKGQRAAGWVAAYLRPWFPDAEKTPNGRRGADIDNTPGIVFEVKTGAEWRPNQWRAQVAGYATRGQLAVLVYLPPGMGEASVGDALAIVPLSALMPLAVAGEYAPPPVPREVI
jgi:hypothetical protein